MGKNKARIRGSDLDGPDFGEFTVSHPDEQSLMSKLWTEAARPGAPGLAQVRMEAVDPKTKRVIAVKSLILDLDQDKLVVLEERNGRLTARRTLPLNPPAHEPDLRPPALDPDPPDPVFLREPFFCADLEIADELRDAVMGLMDGSVPGRAAVVAEVGRALPGGGVGGRWRGEGRRVRIRAAGAGRLVARNAPFPAPCGPHRRVDSPVEAGGGDRPCPHADAVPCVAMAPGSGRALRSGGADRG